MNEVRVASEGAFELTRTQVPALYANMRDGLFARLLEGYQLEWHNGVPPSSLPKAQRCHYVQGAIMGAIDAADAY